MRPLAKASLLACSILGGGVPSLGAESSVSAYIAAAVTAEQCDRRALTLVEELRFTQLIQQRSVAPVTSARIRQDLTVARRVPPGDCAAPAAREQTRLFDDDIRPHLQSPYLTPR